jgi:hypothetical protein
MWHGSKNETSLIKPDFDWKLVIVVSERHHYHCLIDEIRMNNATENPECKMTPLRMKSSWIL